ncbi:MAG: HAMP domain-containing sensor histidine kinase [Verrucomicrobiales bacterium]
MKLSFPLYLKILGWFFLNVLALGVTGLLLLAFQFHLGPEILLSGRSGDRLRALTHTLSEELYARPREEWGEILERFSAGYGLEIRVYGHDQEMIAGPALELPQELKEKLSVRRPGPPRDGNRPRGDRDRDQNRFPPGPPQLQRDPERRPRPTGPPAPNPPTFLLRTTSPKAGYWIGMRMQSQPREGRAPEPMTLLIYSPNLSAGGLIVDFSVWIWVGLGAFLFSVLFWAPLIYNITRSIRQMTEATSHIAEGKFEARVNQNRRDELGTLAGAINQMAERLAGFVSGQKRFTGDIAHELCSPLARMQMAISIMEQQKPMTEKQQAYLTDVREDVEHMSHLVNELLAFSKAALGGKNLRMQPTRLSEVAAKVIKREGREGVVIETAINDELSVMADPDLLFRAISNVLRNAIKYAGDAGTITMSAVQQENNVEITVQDHGPGVPEQDLPRLFDPFYRVDLARARETGGAGLGLAIVKTCVESCGGTVRCRNLEPDGFEVLMRFPAREHHVLSTGKR